MRESKAAPSYGADQEARKCSHRQRTEYHGRRFKCNLQGIAQLSCTLLDTLIVAIIIIIIIVFINNCNSKNNGNNNNSTNTERKQEVSLHQLGTRLRRQHA